MGINDPYDRTGQYSGGDTGPKVEGFAHGQQPAGGYVGDRRDHAIGTMVGDGGMDNRQGYGAILDSIENRISAVDRFNGRGVNGHYGVTKSGELLSKDKTLDSVVTARTGGGGYQFSNWSPKNDTAYGYTQAAYKGTPAKGTEGWYSQAMDVYDTYYRDTPLSLKGTAMGGTYYQNKEALTAKQARGQVSMQEKYGALPVGMAGHVVTGPGLTAFGKQAYGPKTETINGVAYTDEFAMPQMRDSIAYDDVPELETISGVDWNDDFSFDSFTDDLGNYHEFAGFVDDPMQPDAYGGSITGSMSNMGGWEYADDLGGNFQDDIANGVTFDFVGTEDPMAPSAYGPPTAPGFDDPMAPGQYGGGYYSEDMSEDPMAPEAYAPPTASWGEDPMAPGQYGPATADFPAEDDAYGTGYATPTESITGNVSDDWDTASWNDDLTGGYAEFQGTEDPMNPDGYDVQNTMTGQMDTDFVGGTWGDDLATAPTATSSIPAATPTSSTSLPSMAASPAAFNPATPQARTQAPQQAPTSSWGVPSQPPVQRSAPQQQSVPFGRVGGTGDPAATTMRSDRTIADNQGAYGGKDAFGPNDAFGGMGFGRSEYGGYADVVDSYNRATGDITRTITDKQGRVVDQKTVNGGAWAGGGSWDGRATGDTGMTGGNDGRGGGSLGDGSYSESSGRNDNNPQGIL